MFCFIVALKSKQVSADWELDSRLFARTVKSILNQEAGDYRLIVVCHELPSIPIDASTRIEVIYADWPPPTRAAYASLGMSDKWRKLHLGLVHARKDAPEQVMLMDADDLVSRRLVSFCRENRDRNGFVIKKGYDYSEGSRWVIKNNNFNCGTNAVVSCKHFEFPRSMDSSEARRCLILNYGHTVIEEQMRVIGHPLTPMPFRAGVYVSHAQCHSLAVYGRPQRQSFKKVWSTLWMLRPLTPKLQTEFGF